MHRMTTSNDVVKLCLHALSAVVPLFLVWLLDVADLSILTSSTCNNLHVHECRSPEQLRGSVHLELQLATVNCNCVRRLSH